MILRRWRTFTRPETVDQLEPPTTAEALALWLLGTTWILTSLWLAHRGERMLIMPMLAGGLFAVWAWQRDGWRRGVPWTLLAAAIADVLCARIAPALRVLGFLDVTVVGIALVAVARRVAHRVPTDRNDPGVLMPWPVACVIVGVIVFASSGPLGLTLHASALAIGAIAATWTAGRPRRSVLLPEGVGA